MRGALALLGLMLLTILVIGPLQDAAGYPLTAGKQCVIPLSPTETGAFWLYLAFLVLNAILALGRK